MKAVIMAGGKGTRLRPLTCDTPKPMVPVANRPMLEHLIHLLKRHGFHEIYLTTHYLFDRIRSAFGDGSRFGVSLRYVIEDAPLGTAGSVKQVEGEVDQTFLVISGDCLTDFPLSKAVSWHRERNALATMVVTEVENPLQYGIVTTDRESRIERFLEKPRPDQVFSRKVNTGIYVLEPEALRFCPEGEVYDFSRNLFPDLLERGERLMAFPGEGYWSDIGNCDQYIRSQIDALNGRVDVVMPETETPGVWVHESARVHESAEVIPPVMIGAGTRVEAGARIGPGVVLGPRCLVERGAIVESSVVWEDGEIGAEAVARGAAIGSGAVLGRRARLYEGTAVGGRARVGDSATVKPGVKVWAEGFSSASG